MNNSPIFIFRSNSGKTMIFTGFKKSFYSISCLEDYSISVIEITLMMNNIVNCILHINYSIFVNLQ
jgi:hypothetical protein